MAARIRKVRHDENTRLKIKTSQLLNRLQGHALGEIELSQTQVRCIEIALRKVLPDLAAIEHSGETTTNYVAMMPAPVKDMAEWTKRYADDTQQDQPLTDDGTLTQH